MELRFGVCLMALLFLLQTTEGIISRVKRGRKGPPRKPARHCPFNTVNYNISQTWYPVLFPFGYIDCIKCACKLVKNAAKVQCRKRKCVAITCSGAYIRPGDCCKTCPGSSRPVKRYAKSCMYINKTHVHGTVWKVDPSNAADLEPGQCTECSCSDGFVSCAIRSCPRLQCKHPVQSPTSCCQTCPGPPIKVTQRKRGCSSLGRQYSEGEIWHPLLRPYKVKCIVCTCINSSVNCGKVKCVTSKCNPRCCKCPESRKKSVPQAKIAKLKQPPPARYPHCLFIGKAIKRHNSTWKPIISGLSSDCFTCRCQYSRVRCARIICQTNYSCSSPRPVAGECCKVCNGKANQYKTVRLGSKGRKICGFGKKWYVYDFSSLVQSVSISRPNTREIRSQFALEEVVGKNTIARVEIHTMRANNTHKFVHVKTMYKPDFDKWMEELPRRASYRPIGAIREGRRKRIEDKENEVCINNCYDLVKTLMRVLRNRSRPCRASKNLPPRTLSALKEGF